MSEDRPNENREEVMSEGTPAPPDLPPQESPKQASPAKKEPTVEELAEIRKRQSKSALETKTRSSRLFGMLQSTLQSAAAQSANSNQSAGDRRRRELEERLKKQREEEREKGEEEGRREREMRELRSELRDLEDKIRLGERMHKNSQAHIPRDFSPSIPTVLPPSKKSNIPIYYLPYKLTNAQDDLIDDQIAAVKDDIKEEEARWGREKRDMEDKIEQLKLKREGGKKRKLDQDKDRDGEDRDRDEERGEKRVEERSGEGDKARDGERDENGDRERVTTNDKNEPKEGEPMQEDASRDKEDIEMVENTKHAAEEN